MEDEEVMAGRYQRVCERLKELGFEHYEISNFARNGKYSRHNTSYWQQKPYIGFGPSAHSYDLHSRQWNTANLKTYIDHLNEGTLSFEKEELKPIDLYNEYVMTSLRQQYVISSTGSLRIATVISTTACKIILSQNNEQTAQRFSKMIGNKTVQTTSYSKNEGGLGKGSNPFAKNVSYQLQGTSVISTTQLLSLPMLKQVVLMQGFIDRPIMADSPRWYSDSTMKK
ncbi:MAG: type IV secretory system conjugative DNA transfer family protein, partial [Butyricimonas faecihominis]